ncbi:metal resistance protein YCF1 [Panaeolus papilionaceus]|nr:metal resistance protein YCF1 [Panaeolus papilionaceus]
MRFLSCRDKEHWKVVSPHRDFDLTPCFEEGIFLPLLLATFITFALLRSWFLLTYQQVLQRSRRSSLLLNAKLVLLILAAAASSVNASLVLFAKVVVPVSAVYLLEPVAFASSIILTFCNHTRTKRASTILLIFWPTYMVVVAVWTRTMIETHYRTWPALYLKWTAVLLGWLSYTLEILGPNVGLDAGEKVEEENPIAFASIYSIWTFSWMTPLMRKGATQTIKEEDLPSLQLHDEATKLGDDLKNALENYTPWKALFVAYGGPYGAAAILKVTQDLLAFAQPQLLRMLLNYITLYQSTRSQEGRPSKYQGFGIVFLMFASSSIQTICLNQYFRRTIETGLRVRAGLITAIYDKTLALSNDERSRPSRDIINLMSVDAIRLQGTCSSAILSISAPLQITLAFISLYSLLGWASFVGIAIMLLSIPTNTWVARMSGRVQAEQMKVRDKRTRLMKEVLANIKSIKFYAWEYTFMPRILDVRNHQEVVLLKKFCFLVAGSVALWGGIPLLVSFGSFAVAAYTSSTPLTPDVIFPSISLFMLLQFPLGMISQVTSGLVEAMVSINRLTEFLKAEEVQKDARIVMERPSLKQGDVTLSIKHGGFSWSNKNDTALALEGIELVVRKGELVGCLVRSGRASLISAITGDMTRRRGDMEVFGTVAYASQGPWIMTATVRENILFFHEYDETFYNLVVEGCALGPDLALLPDGDLTEVGEKGITLSGGQRARLALARAVYARTDLVLLDDCLAAVDGHVARHVFDNIIGPNGLLSTKARILVTNSITFVRQMNRLLFLQRGIFVEQGTLQQLVYNKDSEISKLIAGHGNKHTSSDASTPTDTSGTITPNATSPVSIDPAPDAIEKLKRRQSFPRARIARITTREAISGGIRKEHKEEGGVKMEVYTEYIKAASKIGSALFLLVTASQQVASVLGNLTLRYWGEHNLEGKAGSISKYLLIYVGFSLSNILLGVASTMLLWMFCSLRSSRRLHDGMLDALFAAPLSFFETTPTGRILNLFSRDIYILDVYIAHLLRDLFYTLMVCLCTTFVIGANFPPFLILAVPLAWFYTRVTKYYLATSRELQRLGAVSRSPIVAWFSDSLAGLSTIRAFSMKNVFRRANARRIDQNQICALPGMWVNRWLAVRLEFVGVFIITTVGLLAMFTLITTGIDAGLVGLVLSYALDTTSSLSWLVRSASSVEQNIVSVERVLHQTTVAPEAPKEVPDAKPAGEWPLQGKVEFRGYATRYRPELDLVLRDISLTVASTLCSHKSREKIGICGRTGAGKSSLLLALFRIIEPASGTIYIDDIDVCKIGLQDLRSALAIVPQSPDLFEGTLRENIDPVGEYSDSDIWVALEQVHLKSYVDGLEGKLDTAVRESGSSLSSGQRQLLCFARALLKKSKILVLDEATSAVDLDTDKAIQEIVKGQAFTNVTILIIAHRLDTIMHSDRVLVMDAGKVAELDTPANLLRNPGSLFYSLSKEARLLSDTTQEQSFKGIEL